MSESSILIRLPLSAISRISSYYPFVIFCVVAYLQQTSMAHTMQALSAYIDGKGEGCVTRSQVGMIHMAAFLYKAAIDAFSS